MKPAHWTADDEEYLITWWGREPVEAIAIRLGRTPGAITQRAYECNLRVNNPGKIHDDEDAADAVISQDSRFVAALFAAIKAGAESAPIGIDRTPGTRNPRYIPHQEQLPRTGSPAATCTEFGD